MSILLFWNWLDLDWGGNGNRNETGILFLLFSDLRIPQGLGSSAVAASRAVQYLFI
jgi:hypothetical protein